MNPNTDPTSSSSSPITDAPSPVPMAGDVVRATVVDATADTWTLEIGSTRLSLPKEECPLEAGHPPVTVGTEVEVFLDVTRPGGPLVASQSKADALRLWDRLSAAAKDGTPIEGQAVAVVKGGLSVDIGTRAFLPASQVDLRGAADLNAMVGQALTVQIVRFDKKRGNIVVSRRALLETERAELRATTLKSLGEGDIVKGTVKSFVQYGAFIDVGGVDGLLHNTDLSWGHVRHPSQLLEIGQSVDVKVLKIEADKGRVSLGLKQLTPDPWTDVEKKYPVGARLRAKVLRLAEFGAFVELEPAVEGLVHVSEMTWSKNPPRPSAIVTAGDEVDVIVLDVKPAERRIGLGMRQLTPNPWTALRERYKNGDRIKGPVKNVTDFGVFVEVAEGFDGLVHASDMAWNERVTPSERFKKGDVVEAVVLDIDVNNQRIALGIKQLTQDPWQVAMERIQPGAKLDGRVTKIVDYGAFIELAPGIEGLCHVTELSNERIDRPDDVVKVGDALTVTVLDVDPSSHRISLSLRALQDPPSSYRDHMQEKPGRFGTALADKLAKKLGVPSED